MKREPHLSQADQDAIVAAVDLVGRTGARDFDLGYVHDDVPVEKAGWYATAYYCGARIIAENHKDPVEAADALARRLLEGGRCNGCGGLVTLSPFGARAFPGRMMDGSVMTEADARAARQCLWRRVGPRWASHCEHREAS